MINKQMLLFLSFVFTLSVRAQQDIKFELCNGTKEDFTVELKANYTTFPIITFFNQKGNKTNQLAKNLGFLRGSISGNVSKFTDPLTLIITHKNGTSYVFNLIINPLHKKINPEILIRHRPVETVFIKLNKNGNDYTVGVQKPKAGLIYKTCGKQTLDQTKNITDGDIIFVGKI